jgi:hypothetical protein
LGEIFPCKGQDICFLGQSTEIWYEKLSKVAGKHLQRTRPGGEEVVVVVVVVVVRKK